MSAPFHSTPAVRHAHLGAHICYVLMHLLSDVVPDPPLQMVRPIEMGVLTLGDGGVHLMEGPKAVRNLPAGWSTHMFNASSQWSNTLPHALHLTSILHHMHNEGEWMSAQISRAGVLLHEIKIEYYDWRFQTVIPVNVTPQPVRGR